MNHFIPENIVLSKSSTEIPYKPKRQNDRGRLKHRGQRKLLMNEILFLTKYGHLSSIVVYAGAAPGVHIPYLSKLFPHHSFTLFDPNPYKFSKDDDVSRISQIRGYFSDDVAKAFTHLHVLFISDIRTANYQKQTPLENETSVLGDIKNQIKWVHLIKPLASMLKFRCLYPQGNETNENLNENFNENFHLDFTDFFGGPTVTIYKQPWAGESSSETRVIFTGIPPLYRYNNQWYENCMYYYNNCIRSNTFDTKFEIYIITEYIKNAGYVGKTQQEIINDINKLLGFL